MSDRTKIQGTWDSTSMSNVPYKPSWRQQVEARTPNFRKAQKTGKAFAAENVNDLRPLRGALSRVIDILLASAQSQLWGPDAPLFLKKGD